jgi:hypothetical protein
MRGAGQFLIADRAYDSDAVLKAMQDRRAWANIKPLPGRNDIQPIRSFLYRYRNLVECFFNKVNASEPSPSASQSMTKTSLPSSNSQPSELASRLWVGVLERRPGNHVAPVGNRHRYIVTGRSIVQIDASGSDYERPVCLRQECAVSRRRLAWPPERHRRWPHRHRGRTVC